MSTVQIGDIIVITMEVAKVREIVHCHRHHQWIRWRLNCLQQQRQQWTPFRVPLKLEWPMFRLGSPSLSSTSTKTPMGQKEGMIQHGWHPRSTTLQSLGKKTLGLG